MLEHRIVVVNDKAPFFRRINKAVVGGNHEARLPRDRLCQSTYLDVNSCYYLRHIVVTDTSLVAERVNMRHVHVREARRCGTADAFGRLGECLGQARVTGPLCAADGVRCVDALSDASSYERERRVFEAPPDARRREKVRGPDAPFAERSFGVSL